ncbi:zinc finger protein ZIC 4 [Platysternon megacephalum]|uniref:Zinc finger protein ZIC 4 n=1 Tax=Platysternon megacephalum TaxID=55544 RepID=A0A4D9EIM6_9SAUR|nr:zinc finger protein ZIC 4 [Platysternon megacephalum]
MAIKEAEDGEPSTWKATNPAQGSEVQNGFVEAGTHVNELMLPTQSSLCQPCSPYPPAVIMVVTTVLQLLYLPHWFCRRESPDETRNPNPFRGKRKWKLFLH